jgi:hypothetical protein
MLIDSSTTLVEVSFTLMDDSFRYRLHQKYDRITCLSLSVDGDST